MQNTSKLPGVKSIQCLLCSKVTINVGNMKQHFEVHHYRRTYSCDVCNKTCKTKNCLFVHKKTYGHNTSTQPKLWLRFSWITCQALINKLFRWTWLWRICESKLPDSRQMQCLLCNKITIHIGNMKQHFEVNHYHRTYNCEVCMKSFKTKKWRWLSKKEI